MIKWLNNRLLKIGINSVSLFEVKHRKDKMIFDSLSRYAITGVLSAKDICKRSKNQWINLTQQDNLLVKRSYQWLFPIDFSCDSSCEQYFNNRITQNYGQEVKESWSVVFYIKQITDYLFEYILDLLISNNHQNDSKPLMKTYCLFIGKEYFLISYFISQII